MADDPKIEAAKPEPQEIELPVLPLQNTTLFPETVVPLAVGRDRSTRAVEAALPLRRSFSPASRHAPTTSRVTTPRRMISSKSALSSTSSE